MNKFLLLTTLVITAFSAQASNKLSVSAYVMKACIITKQNNIVYEKCNDKTTRQINALNKNDRKVVVLENGIRNVSIEY